jgi:hypothetical protein
MRPEGETMILFVLERMILGEGWSLEVNSKAQPHALPHVGAEERAQPRYG